MAVFYILILVPIAIQHFAIKGHRVNYKKKNQIALMFFFIFLTLLVMFRHVNVGSDTANYIHYFDKFSNSSWDKLAKYSLEFGYTYFNKIVSLVSMEPQFFLATAAVAITAMIYPTYKRLCVDTVLTMVLFCTMSTFVMMFSGVRQMMAIGMGFIAYEFTRRKKLVFFILIVILAMTFHTSSFMLAFMYPLYHAKITKKWLWVAVPVLLLVFLFNKQIFFLLAFFLEQYTDYDASITSTGAYTMLILFVIFAVFSFLIPDESRLDEETIGLRNFLMLSVTMQMFSPLHTIAMRMNYYYIIFIPLLIPKIIECRSKKWGRVAEVSRDVMVVFFLLYFFISAYGSGNLRVFPYHFFWENV